MSVAQEERIITAPAPAPRVTVWRRFRNISLTWERAALISILGLATFLNFFRLDQQGYTNEYYAAAVRSMMTSFHNFFYNSYDAGGYITIDKPPVAFWFETISAWIFGFNGVSILLPSAIAGVLSVYLVYRIIKKPFGAVAGLLAALALTVTPIFVVMSRHNNPESILILFLVLGAGAMLKAAEKGKLLWLFLAVAMVGVAFNVKMLQAFVVLPAFYAVYFLLAPIKWWKRIVHLAAATVVLAVVSLSWTVAVQLTPADQRPYIGGSSDNTVIDLIINYNGLGRVEGNQMGGAGGATDGTRTGTQTAPTTDGNGTQTAPTFPQAPTDGIAPTTRTDGGAPAGGGAGGGVIAGQSGPFRLFESSLAGEAGWVLPLALLGMVVAGIQSYKRFPRGIERRQRLQALMLWGGWLVTFMVVFSMAKGIFHSYYLVMLAPAIAALAGAGTEALWHSYKRGGWQSWLLPTVLIVSAAFQLHLLSGYSDWNRTLALIVAGLELVCACALLALPRLFKLADSRWAQGVTAGGVLGLLIVPTAWAFHAVLIQGYTNATLPTAVVSGSTATSSSGGGFGRATTTNFNFTSQLVTSLQAHWNGWLSGLVVALLVVAVAAIAVRFVQKRLPAVSRSGKLLTVASVLIVVMLGMSMTLTALPTASASTTTRTNASSAGFIGNPSVGVGANAKLISYLEANRNGSEYLLVTASSQNASAIIIATGQPVMAMGGFSGQDAVMTVARFQELVQNNSIRYVLLGGAMGGRGGSSSVTSWVQTNCSVVDSSLWSSSTTTTTNTEQTTTDGRTDGGGFGGNTASQLYLCTSK